MDKFALGVTVYYGCKDGYELVGNMSINCTEAGAWSRPLPRCKGGWMLHCLGWGWQRERVLDLLVVGTGQTDLRQW